MHTKLEAGLPNITGQTGKFVRCGELDDLGSLSKQTEITNTNSLASGNTIHYGGIYFDASRSNPLYGKSLIVQPNSLIAQYLIKY